MSWSKLHGGAHQHRKVLQLEAALGCSELEARGLVLTLWSWTIQSEPDGVLDGWSAAALARVWGWRGDAVQMIDALVASGLLDRTDGGLEVHDWMDHAEGWRDAKRKRKERQEKRRRARPENVQDAARTVLGLSVKRPVRGEERRGEERKGEEKRREEEILGSGETPQTEAASPVVCMLPLVGGKSQPITEEDVQRFASAFPGVDIPAELAKMESWLDANATKRPRSSAKAFAHRWLTKAQDDVSRTPRGHQSTENATQFALRLAREERAREEARAQSDGGQLRLAAKVDRYTARAPPEPVGTIDPFGDHEEATA